MTLRKFAANHPSIKNHFNQDRHFDRCDIFKQNRSAVLAERRQLWPERLRPAPFAGRFRFV